MKLGSFVRLDEEAVQEADAEGDGERDAGWRARG